MGCLSHRKKQTEDFADQRWEYISLNDFKARGCGPGFAYGWLWFLLIISIAVYVVDSIVAVNLLIFDRWTGSIEPGIPLNISKWIFSGCILLSFVNLGFEGWRAVRVIKRGNVAESYLDPLAVRWESIRPGAAQGWKRFLVFTELTKGKKGGEYIALFTYFSLTSWIRVLVCSGPRQVVNAFTLKSVYEVRLAVHSSSVEGSLSGFFGKIKALAEEDYQQAVILGGMCFTFVVWVFSALFLLAAVLFYVFFLFHWLPRADGGLHGYCERKINQAVKKIVTQKVNRALAKSHAKQANAEAQNALKGGEKPRLDRMATLPTLPNITPLPAQPAAMRTEDSLPQMPTMDRFETPNGPPAPISRTNTGDTTGTGLMGPRRPLPSRTGTVASASSVSSRTPLVGAAADMGHGRSESPVPSIPDINLAMLPRPQQPGTPSSQRTFGQSGPGMGHMNTGSYSSSPRAMVHDDSMSGYPVPGMQQEFGPPLDRRDYHSQAGPGPRQFKPYNPSEGRASPTPSPHYGRPPVQRQYSAHHEPQRSVTGNYAPRGPQYPPQRNLTGPMPPPAQQDEYFSRSITPQDFRAPAPRHDFQRSGTPQSQGREPYDYDVEGQSNRGYGW